VLPSINVSDQLSHPYKTTGNKTIITKVYKGNSIVIIPTQHYDIKTQNIVTENHFQTINTDPTKAFQIQIRNTINHSKTIISQDSRWKYL